eukprot:6181741-Pleurochrysis_carterae.AAC.2
MQRVPVLGGIFNKARHGLIKADAEQHRISEKRHARCEGWNNCSRPAPRLRSTVACTPAQHRARKHGLQPPAPTSPSTFRSRRRASTASITAGAATACMPRLALLAPREGTAARVAAPTRA